MTLPFDILFLCHASPLYGFGHMRRCVAIALELQKQGSCRIAFQGAFVEAASHIIQSALPDADILADNCSVAASLAVIDRMFDSEDPENYDLDYILTVSQQADLTVLICSSLTVPDDLPVDAVIGHLLEPDLCIRPKLYAGMKYAPVGADIRRYAVSGSVIQPQCERVLLAYQSITDVEILDISLGGLAEVESVKRVDILLPPSIPENWKYIETADRRRISLFDVVIHRNVASVAELMVQQDIVIGTYGNITYEAMALGVPYVVAGVKRFQDEYGRWLAAKGCIAHLGMIGEITSKDIQKMVSGLGVVDRRRISRMARACVDADGIPRIAQICREMIHWKLYHNPNHLESPADVRESA